MIKNFLKVAWRNLMRYKVFSFINIISLAIGIAFAGMIGLWVQEEFSYNNFHEKQEDLYFIRVNADWGGIQTWPKTPGPLAESIQENIPEVEAVTRLTGDIESLLSYENRNQKSNGLYVDEDFLSMFSFEFLEGDQSTALEAPNSIILTQSLAESLFPNENPIGQSILIDKTDSYTVTGIIASVPTNSEIQFKWLAPWNTWAKDRDWVNTWGNVSFRTYLEVAPDADQALITHKLNQFEPAKEHNLEFFLQPLSRTYLYSKFEEGKQKGGRIEYVRLFSTIAIFLLIVACINFMNLATARSSIRAKEIGIRKTVGASQRALQLQFMGEAVMLAFLASFLALTLMHYGIASFNRLFEKEISVDYTQPQFWLSLVGLSLLAGLLAGSYPAFLLSSFKPVKVLKGETFSLGDRSAIIRKGLVIFQFSLSIFLIVATMVIHRQIHFVKNKNLGLDRKDIFSCYLDGQLYDQRNTFRQMLMDHPAIESVTFTMNDPMNLNGSSGDLVWPGKTEDEAIIVAPMVVSEGFTETFGIEMSAGRDFSSDLPHDTSNYIVNESAVKAMGLENPIGTQIEFWMGEGTIIGVTKDYHFQSLHLPIRPMVISYIPENAGYTWIKPVAGKTKEAIAATERMATRLNPGYPFQYEFADEAFARLYKNETITGSIANIFGVIAIIVSCLGLFGLSAYAAERRRKEIGIRKVLGASIKNVVFLLSGDFLRLVIISILIAMPLAWLFTNQWLQNFAYRTNIAATIFVSAAIIAIVTAFITVSFQSIKAAIINPVDSLRDE